MITYTVEVDEDGTERWLLNGELHRINGPAFDHVDGSKIWAVDGKFHRLDGPAVIYPDGTKYWYIDDKQMTEEEFLLAIQPSTTSE